MRFVAALLIGAVCVGPALAREVVPAEDRANGYSASLPVCENMNVLGEIADRFGASEFFFWDTPIRIMAFENIREIAWRPWGLDVIPRRFCSGTVQTSDGIRRKIDFSIREGLSFIGASWGTEYCVDGFDRSYAYAPLCRQARP